MHSTHWINLEYNVSAFIKEIKHIAKDYDTVVVCMYWKDIINNAYERYINEGFEIVSAGHIYDSKNFLPRLKSIIELSDMVISNDVGSYVGQSIALNKPCYLFRQDYVATSSNKDIDCNEYDERLKDENYIKNFEIFSSPKPIITNNQRAFANYLWETDIHLTRQQMINILF